MRKLEKGNIENEARILLITKKLTRRKSTIENNLAGERGYKYGKISKNVLNENWNYLPLPMFKTK